MPIATEFGWRGLDIGLSPLDARVMSPSCGPVDGSGGIISSGMGIKVAYKDGVFAPLDKVEGVSAHRATSQKRGGG